jgi:UDP-glucose 4-epimerase
VADENWPYNPSTFYNVHKIYGEMLCKIYSQLYGINYVKGYQQ